MEAGTRLAEGTAADTTTDEAIGTTTQSKAMPDLSVVPNTEQRQKSRISFSQAYIGQAINNVRMDRSFMGAPEHTIVFEALIRLGNGEILRTALRTKMLASRVLLSEAKRPQEIEYALMKQVLDEIYPEWVNLTRKEQLAN